MAGVLGAAAVCFAVAAVVRVTRWQLALAQRRRARDPQQALLLPPSASHSEALRRSKPDYATFLKSLLVIAAYCAILVAGGAPVVKEITNASDEAVQFTVLAVTAVLLGVLVVAALRMWRRLLARDVRKLSQDASFAEMMPPTTATLSRYRATAIPELKLTFYAPQRVWYTGLSQVTAERNVFGRPPWRIAYFRLFENEVRVRDFVKGAFRECGYVHLLRSAASVGRAELVRARQTGTVGQLFITSDHRMTSALYHQPTEPLSKGRHPIMSIGSKTVRVRDRKGSYPVATYLCHGSYWQRAVDILLSRSDIVVIDLSGFRRENAGTGYELQRVIDRFPIRQVILLADTGSDTAYLETQIRHAWSMMAHDSPNAGTGSRHLLVSTIPIGGARATRQLLAYMYQRLG
ncbi:hypothetical protein [Nonomuraea africana]|uniref:Uncharacterized protein n=2 Tax=Nonomuraea africana TaxID=46171 RepID=A0ABR9K969_9ACTN|nr:hypothetical protein [Nonomuraea africana]MBE1558298.1 hypothetical protein [Nonomuraea africana]